ncbi:MAG: hypothetical protein LJE91_05940 [Gammaproteobacteria bacterium]|nr:hypothetical protein [Gammaproteobacteria bacterium]
MDHSGIDLPFLFLDDHLAAVHKPAGLLVDTTWGKSAHNRLFRKLFGNEGLLLAATGLGLAHPLAGRSLRIDALPDMTFQRVVDALGWGPASENSFWISRHG